MPNKKDVISEEIEIMADTEDVKQMVKKAPAKRAITGSFAPQGINGANIAVARLSRSLGIVRQAITPGTAQPVPITNGITDFPERPTFLNIGSSTTLTRAI